MRPLAILYLVGLHVLCGYLIVESRAIERLGNRVHALKVGWGLVPIEGRVVYLGDSITKSAPLGDGDANLGVSGLKSDRMPAVLARYDLKSAKAASVLIGVNDLQAGNRPSFDKIVPHLRGTRVVWSGVLPAPLIAPEALAAANTDARAACATLPRCEFIEVPLQRQHFKADGMHLNQEGYAFWLSSVGRVLAKNPAL